jgi:nucleoside-diphosphate-sugar epimerase
VRVVIAGGRGFIGRHVVAAMGRAGHETIVVGRGESIPTADAVVHLGLYSEADAVSAAASVRGTGPRLVVASSGDVYRVYGWILGTEAEAGGAGPLDENAPLRTQLYPYGRERGTLIDYDKILVERVVREAGAVVLRLPKVYGPGDPQATFSAHVERIRAGVPVVVGESVASWRWTHGYVEDVAEAFLLAAVHPGIEGRTYNVGEAPTPPLADRVRALARAAGSASRIDIVPDDDVPVDLRVPIVRAADLVYDTRRIRGELGWRERVPEGEALRRTVESL